MDFTPRTPPRTAKAHRRVVKAKPSTAYQPFAPSTQYVDLRPPHSSGLQNSLSSLPLTHKGQILYTSFHAKRVVYFTVAIDFRPPGSDFNFYPPCRAARQYFNQLRAWPCRFMKTQHSSPRISHRKRQASALIETYHYPYGVAKLDGQDVEISTEQVSGLMLVDLPCRRAPAEARLRSRVTFAAHCGFARSRGSGNVLILDDYPRHQKFEAKRTLAE